LADRVRAFRHHGQREKGRHEVVGGNERLDEIQAAVLSVKLRYLDRWNERRRAIAAYYRERLSRWGCRFQEIPEGAEPVYHIFAIRVRRRDRVLARLEERGVEWGRHVTPPVHLQPGYAFLEYPAGSFPVAEKLAQELVSLPIYPELSDAQVERVVEAVIDAVEEGAVVTTSIGETQQKGMQP
jgi:dTDP-3-amino-3,4,6-trideoxy-alpha-D-glucose transaminase